MSDETTTKPDEQVEHVHIYEARWYPLDRRSVRRVCVLPGCTHVQVKEVTA